MDLAVADRRQVFDRISLLNQEFERWPFTATTNIGVGRPGRPDPAERDRAAAYAGADTVIAALPDGMETLLARQFRRGAELSGGQWQKIGLARSAFRRARLVIADEPTSALDPAAEIATFERIRAMADADTTVVLVTHRMAAVRHADEIFVLHQGCLVEHGDHDTLMEQRGRYAAMFKIQADQYTAERETRLPGQPQPAADAAASTP